VGGACWQQQQKQHQKMRLRGGLPANRCCRLLADVFSFLMAKQLTGGVRATEIGPAAAALRTSYTNRLNPVNDGGTRNVPSPVIQSTRNKTSKSAAADRCYGACQIVL